MGSMLENYKDADLKRYMKFVFSIIKDEEFGNPEELYHYDRLDLLFSPIGGKYDRLDIEYLYYLLSNNEKEHLITPGIDIDRPQLDEMDVTYNIEEKQWITTSYFGTLETYISDDISMEYLYELKANDEIDPYAWQYDSDVSDTDYLDENWDF
jgi:hypothetical protein